MDKEKCKHEWRQLWKDDSFMGNDGQLIAFAQPTDDFYCIHCLEIKRLE